MNTANQLRYRNLAYVFSGEVEMGNATPESIRQYARAIGDMSVGDHSMQGRFMRRLSSAMHDLSRGGRLSHDDMCELMHACGSASLEASIENAHSKAVASLLDSSLRFRSLS
ncbi:MAG: hypothetical protein EBQ96_08980 [Proteobacteria bacterium]|nr:hypothetical protein [Pseudomonadota bacterium]